MFDQCVGIGVVFAENATSTIFVFFFQRLAHRTIPLAGPAKVSKVANEHVMLRSGAHFYSLGTAALPCSIAWHGAAFPRRIVYCEFILIPSVSTLFDRLVL